ncbi:MAG: PH domain-containing protein [Candidatus Coproplasma sp.]
MGKYVESNLGKNEVIIKKADRNGLFLLGAWIKGILLCWMLLIPTIKAIIATVQFSHVELAITNKRIVGKSGVLNTKAMDSPLNKIQNVSVSQPFFGKVFNYSTVKINTAAGEYTFSAIKNGDSFKNMILAQQDAYEEERIAQQASAMANAVAGAIKK